MDHEDSSCPEEQPTEPADGKHAEEDYPQQRRMASLARLAHRSGLSQSAPQSARTQYRQNAALMPPTRPPKWTRRLLLSGLLLLAIVAFLALPAGFPLHAWLSRLAPLPAATATPALPLSVRRLYLAADVPGMLVRLDGHQTPVAAIGHAAPLTLSPGVHHLTWGAVPFKSQSCQFSMPLTAVTSCDLLPGAASIDGIDGGPPAPVIELGESLDTLPAAQESALLRASQSALSRLPATIVEPGERYVTSSGPQVAMTPFAATLTFQIQSALDSGCGMDVLDTASGPCQLEPGEDCARFCGLTWTGQQAVRVASGATGWLVLAAVSLSWTYRRLDGSLLARNQPLDWVGAASLNNHLLMLSIQWNEAGWRVTPLWGDQVGGILQDSDGQPVADDPGCAQAEDLLYNLDVEESGGPVSATIHLAGGSNPSAGCLVTAGSAVYLVRLGVVLAVNQPANALGNYDPPLPHPSLTANEKQLVLELQALHGQNVSTT